MKTIFRMVAVAFATLILSSCATLAPPQLSEFRLSRTQLQALVGKPFETAQSYLGLLDIKLTTLRGTLQPESNRVPTALDGAINVPLIGKSWKCVASISGRLRFDHGSSTILLEDPRAGCFKVDGFPAAYADRVNKVGGWLTEQVLKGFAVYKRSPSTCASTMSIMCRRNTR